MRNHRQYRSREGHRAALCVLSGLATLLRSRLGAGGVGEQPIFIVGGEPPSGHGAICRGANRDGLQPAQAVSRCASNRVQCPAALPQNSPDNFQNLFGFQHGGASLPLY